MAKICDVENYGRSAAVFHNGFMNSVRHFVLAGGETLRGVELEDHVAASLSQRPDISVTILGEPEPKPWTPPCLVRYPRGPRLVGWR